MATQLRDVKELAEVSCLERPRQTPSSKRSHNSPKKYSTANEPNSAAAQSLFDGHWHQILRRDFG
jgi:hypothetical protein